MKLLLLGANGQVGRELRRALTQTQTLSSFRRKPESIEFFAETKMDSGLRRNDGDESFSLGEVILASRNGALFDGSRGEVADLAQPDTLPALLDRIHPDIIVNAAAHTAVDRAEDEPELAHRVNAEAVGVLARWAAAHDALMVHYSTDYVFDGQGNRPWREDDPVAPLGVYGASKLAGEQALHDSGAAHFLFRTAWVYAAHGHNFLKTMLRLGAERERLSVVDDQHGTPTPASLIADVTATVIGQWRASDTATRAAQTGTWHLVADGHTTWCGFARAIMGEATAMGLLPRAPQVDAITSAEFPTPAQRPAWSVLDTSRLRRTFGIELPRWEDGLKSVLADVLCSVSI
ncbi:MAG TPA: dTDP-4-dehydrorhamnose reductase [Rhodanobacteraceae bacterium]|nr:dTDP-4-dehydrorhamnose reductase [Rhodanobacteraceae bacterium]